MRVYLVPKVLLLALVTFVHGKEVQKHWGIPDSSGSVFRQFNLSIPSNAFSGHVTHFEVSEAGESALPDWLSFDDSTKSFVGVPQQSGLYYIIVKAFGSNKNDLAKDVFSLEISDEQSSKLSCPDQTMASLLLDLEMSEMKPIQRVQLIQKMAERVKKSPDMFELKAAGVQGLEYSNTLSAGPGNSKLKKYSGVILQWPISCSGSMDEASKKIVSELELSAADGSLALYLYAEVIGWKLSSLQMIPTVKREKRFFKHLYDTPIPGIVVPTRYIPKKIDASETDAIPESRIVPTMASPIFTFPSHHHRHHHGESKISPTATLSFPVASQMFHTPLPFPDRPSKYIVPSMLPVDTSSQVMLQSTFITPHLEPSQTQEWPSRTFPMSSDYLTAVIRPSKTSVIEETTIGVTNFIPRVKNHIKKLSMVAGKVWSFKIPPDTFWDMEDGNTSKLKLFFYNSGKTNLNSSSWIQFDPVKQEIYALPTTDQIGAHEFILEAMDSDLNSTTDRLEIEVWENDLSSKFHHNFIIAPKFESWRFSYFIDWEIELIKRIAEYFGDEDTSLISVIRASNEPHSITWTNDSLPFDYCPKQQIETLYHQMTKENGVVIKALKKVLQPDFKVHKMDLEFSGICHLPEVPFVATTEVVTKDWPPTVYNPIDYLNYTVGDIVRFRIPNNTFTDFEDGDTSQLQLSLLTIDKKVPSKSSWILLDPVLKELFGLPMDQNEGKHYFQLVATDQDGLFVSNPFYIYVNERPLTKHGVEIEIKLDENFDNFNKDLSRKVLLPWKIAKAFGDDNPKNVNIQSIRPGSVLVSWANTTLPKKSCPRNKIEDLAANMINENGAISDHIMESLQPEFEVTKIRVIPQGSCIGVIDPIIGLHPSEVPTIVDPDIITLSPKSTGVPALENTTYSVDDPNLHPDADIYISTIIPAVVIAVMIVITAMIACFLYRKKLRNKNYTQDSTYMPKGIPIIFAEELEEKTGPAKAPMIMKEERGPLIPRHHRNYPDDNHESLPLTEPKALDTFHSHTSPPYHPPPPFPSSHDVRGARPKATSGYRQPPPYCVPP